MLFYVLNCVCICDGMCIRYVSVPVDTRGIASHAAEVNGDSSSPPNKGLSKAKYKEVGTKGCKGNQDVTFEILAASISQLAAVRSWASQEIDSIINNIPMLC